MVIHSSVIMSDMVAKLMMVLLANFVDKFHYEQTLFAKRMSVWTYLSLLKKREPSVSTVPLFCCIKWVLLAVSTFTCADHSQSSTDSRRKSAYRRQSRRKPP